MSEQHSHMHGWPTGPIGPPEEPTIEEIVAMAKEKLSTETKPSEMAKRIAENLCAWRACHRELSREHMQRIIAEGIAPLEASNELLRKSLRSAEDQLCSISRTFGGKDARHVTSDGEYTIAGMVAQEVAALRQQVERLRGALFMAKGYIAVASPCPEENMVLVEIDAALSAQPAAEPTGV